MKEVFFDLTDALAKALGTNETLLCYLSAERSDFVRFTQALVRQAGSVEQAYATIRLVTGKRHAAATIALSGTADDLPLARATLAKLRETLSQVPEDPWLLIAETPVSTTTERRGRIPAADDVVRQVTSAAKRLDLVGFYASGTSYRAFANSLGQRNWHEIDTFGMDWSVYLHADKAVKASYAGFDWEPGIFKERLQESARRLGLMEAPARVLDPGEYRAYLAPPALAEITGLLEWNAFSARARETRRSALLRMDYGERLSARVSMLENTETGIAPAFQQDGFVKPSRVTLIDRGRLADSLVSPRSAREYGLQTNGAGPEESPQSLEILPGDLVEADILRALDTGLYVGNLWYLNFSDRAAGRITGMTRFGTFWVEGGRITAPVHALRFDDTLYRMLGEKLVDLTNSPELLLSTWTYGERSTASSRLPGALLESMRFTL
ncbi:MAG: TldD/PmbA family protein [Burkholderiales bacterium]